MREDDKATNVTISPEEEEIPSQHLTGCEGWEIVLWSAGNRGLATDTKK